MRKLFAFIFACSTTVTAIGQSGGDNIFEFLNLPHSARVGALGGKQVSIWDDDLNFVHSNPSLLQGNMSNQVVVNYLNYIADINYGYVAYARTFEKYGNFGLGVQYFDYGDFTYANEYGHRYGEFKAKDYTINIYYSRPVLDSLLHLGGALKLINSKYEVYTAFGVALDAGLTFYSEEKLFSAAIVMKNLGFQLNTYSSTSGQEPLPFEIQLGVTQKLRYAPFRLSLMVQHLETPDLLYTTEEERKEEDNNSAFSTDEQSDFERFGDNLFRHVIFGLEFVPTKNFHIDLGYNYKRRQELKIADKPGWSGISFGFGLKLYKFRLSYSHASYHLAAVSDQFSVTFNLSDFAKQ